MTKKTIEELWCEAKPRTSIPSSAGLPPNGFGAGQLLGALLTGLGAAAVGETTHEMAKEQAELQMEMAKAIYEKAIYEMASARGSSPTWDDASEATQHLYLKMAHAALTVVHEKRYDKAESKHDSELEIEDVRCEMHAWIRDLTALDALLADTRGGYIGDSVRNARNIAREAVKSAAVAYSEVVNKSSRG